MTTTGHGPSACDWRRVTASGLLALSVLAAAPREARADAYKDEKLGFQLNTPKKWKRLPLAADERWIVASWTSDREWVEDDPKTMTYARHRPQIDVVILAKSETEKKGGTTVEETDEGTVVTFDKSYKDFKDYLDKTTQRYGGGGFFFSKEEETKVGDMRVVAYEITIEKLADAPKKRWAWAFYAEDAIYGLVGDALTKYEDKVRPDIEAAYKSFKVIPHSEALGRSATGNDGTVVIRKPGEKVTTEDKAKKREDDFQTYLARVVETMTEGWKRKETAHFVAITHRDDKYTKDILEHAEAVRGWLDANLGYLGPAVPGKAIIRICADEAEYDSMWKSGGWAGYRFELYIYDNQSITYDSRFWTLNSGIYRIWLQEKNDELEGRLPVFVSYGLSACIRSATSKGKKVEFSASGYRKERTDALRRDDKLVTARDFLTKGTDELNGAEDAALQAECFARFLLTGGAQKSPKFRNVLTDYLTNFVAMVEEQSKETGSDDTEKEATSEEEESAQFRERMNKWKERERAVLDELLEKTFQGWTDKDWDAFDRAYWKDLGV